MPYMEPTTFWLVLFVILLIIEGCTFTLTTIWFAIGALAALLVSWIHSSLIVQASAFALVSLIAFLLTGPFMKKCKEVPLTHTNSDRNIGRIAQVLTEIDPTRAGRVRLDGVDWTAQINGEGTLHPGDLCRIISMQSTVLIVEPWHPSENS